MRNLKLLLEYDGTRFAGWQIQPEVRTVQAVIEAALLRLTGDACRVTGASRTDAGVHALGQVANFHTAAGYSPEVFYRALNAILSRDVAVLGVEEVDKEFDARRGAKGKLYRYLIHNRRPRSVFDYAYSWYLPVNLDIEAMRKAGNFFLGIHDFSSFRSSSCNAKSPIRQIYRLDIYTTGNSTIRIEVEGSGFLKQMVRTMVGTLVSIGQGKLLSEQVSEIIAARDRGLAGPTAPARGLFLVRVDYER
jgi:tRNA pseudouridine38-40 synthase